LTPIIEKERLLTMLHINRNNAELQIPGVEPMQAGTVALNYDAHTAESCHLSVNAQK